jgi:phage baseplate assembly protein W
MDEITAYELGDRVLEAIRIWDNRIEVEQIKVQPKYDLQQYNILISFSIRGIRESQEFDFILRKI